MPGRGTITLTGQIGDVMKESATAAFSLLRSRAEQYHIDSKLLAESDIHIHVPAGAIPKDGPSAGVAMFVALASLLDESSGEIGCLDDRRDHAARTGSPDRRIKGKDPRRQARRGSSRSSCPSAMKRICRIFPRKCARR